ncbi:angiomotin [Asanoa hainanensis]|uniref:Angiomotin n=1 Tax=Asanoa hainanensis TaxID=560556 RepID=A0A239P385_9ACTN|nr:LPXTG cell wall anchor domain-containing protein [Asanoa hainanensis]SNT61597.1 angiomotin [Asanoa hainanensis]
MRNRLSLILAAFALLVPAIALTSVAAQAAPAAHVAAAPCPPGSVKQDYYCVPTDTPTTPPAVTEEPEPQPTPMLPQTGADAGVVAGIGGGVLLVGVVIALWATAFRRRHRFEA